MRKILGVIALGLTLALAGSATARADSSETAAMLQKMQQRIDELEAKVQELEAPAEASGGTASVADLTSRVESLEGGLMDGLNGFQFGGLVYGSYNHNFNSPDSRQNSLRSYFDGEDNNFTMDLLQLEVSKETESGVGFYSVLDYGDTADRIQSSWAGEDGLADNFEIQQAYMTYNFGIGNGVEMKFGKFATLLGGEVIESPYNPNVTRSFMFGNAIPFTHTGVLFSTAINDMVSLTAGVVNGWDSVKDNNNGKSFLGSLGFEVGDLAWTFNAVAGPEGDESGKSKTAVFDTVLTYTPMDNVDLLLNFDYGMASDVLCGTSSFHTKNGIDACRPGDDDDAEWTALSGIVTLGGVLLNPDLEAWSIALRGEWFSDNNDYRLGAWQTNRNVNLWEVTGTLKWQMTEHLQARLEYRHDGSNRNVFADGGSMKDDQDTMILEFAYLM